MTTTRRTRHAATATLALATALTLAACGGDDAVAPPPEPAPSEDADTSEPAEPETTDAAEPTETEEPTSEDTEEPTSDDSAEEPSSDGSDDGASASGDLPQVDVTWPEEWVDMSDQLPEQPGLWMEVYGVPNPEGFSMNGVVVTYPAGSVPEGSSYGDLLVQGMGGDSGQLTEVGERDIDGHTAVGYQQDAAQGGITFRQRLYGVVLEDGSVVEFVLSAEVDQITEGMETFETVLDSAVING